MKLIAAAQSFTAVAVDVTEVYMKKVLCLFMALVMLCFCGCTTAQKDDGFNIVCASFAEYDWVKNLTLGTDVKVDILADTGTDMHSYQPTAADVLSISKADLVVYNGGTADGWMSDAIKNSGFKGKSIRIMDIIGKGLIHQHHDDDHRIGTSYVEYDEHVWLSLKNAVIACNKLAHTLAELDKANQEKYNQNCTDYVKKLETLDKAFANAIEEGKSVVIADRFPFLYLMTDYKLNWHAAYEGCSSETDADFEKVLSLAKTVDKEGINTLFIIEGGTDTLAKTVISNTASKNQQILTLDSMQSVTKKDIESGKNYLDTMAKNLENLKKALN